MVSREWKNGSNSSYNSTPFLHSLLTKGKIPIRPLLQFTFPYAGILTVHEDQFLQGGFRFRDSGLMVQGLGFRISGFIESVLRSRGPCPWGLASNWSVGFGLYYGIRVQLPGGQDLSGKLAWCRR